MQYTQELVVRFTLGNFKVHYALLVTSSLRRYIYPGEKKKKNCTNCELHENFQP